MPHNGVQVVRTSQVPLVASGESRQVKIWEFEGTAYDQGDVAAEWITTYLGEPHRLVRYAGNDMWLLQSLSKCFVVSATIRRGHEVCTALLLIFMSCIH